jgi:DNA polymerase-4
MDGFFAAVEQLDNPALRGKPILVGHDGPRGVVSTASYEARPFGCHSAQPMAVAKRLCPHAIVVPVRMRRYSEVSDQLFTIFADFSPLVEGLSVDEAFLDVTGCDRLVKNSADAWFAVDIARRMKHTIRAELKLTASIGVATNKFLAKLASDLQKPDGLTVVPPDGVDRLLPPLPVTKIWGIGPKTAARLADMNIRTIGDLRRMTDEWFASYFGEDGDHYRRLAHGLDERPVIPDSGAKSIGQEETFSTDLIHADELRHVLLGEVEHVATRLRRHKLLGGGVRLKIRFGSFQTITRSRKLDAPTDSTDVLWQAARALFDEWARDHFQPVRLLGFTADISEDNPQLPLFPDPLSDKRRRLDQTLDKINDRFGGSTIRRAPRREE